MPPAPLPKTPQLAEASIGGEERGTSSGGWCLAVVLSWNRETGFAAVRAARTGEVASVPLALYHTRVVCRDYAARASAPAGERGAAKHTQAGRRLAPGASSGGAASGAATASGAVSTATSAASSDASAADTALPATEGAEGGAFSVVVRCAVRLFDLIKFYRYILCESC